MHKGRRCEKTQGEDDLEPWGYRKQGERPGIDPHHPLTQLLRGNMALLTPWPWISALQNCETINFHCSKSPAVVFCYSYPTQQTKQSRCQVKSSIVTEPHRAQPQISWMKGCLSLASPSPWQLMFPCDPEALRPLSPHLQKDLSLYNFRLWSVYLGHQCP